MSSGKVMLGILAGITAGAIIGILFAPDKGSETRKKISTLGDEYAEELKDKFNEFVENISQKCEEALRSCQEEANHAESEAQEIKVEG
jgi:gas vesicle protein